ncbi:MAG: hypothetical protein ACJ8DM_18920 [Microvirga sp.]
MDEILINTSTAGNQEQPAVAGFRGTQFVAVWEDREDGNIKGQMLSPGGNKTSGEFVVNFPGLPATRRRMPAIVETMSGFVVAWTEQAPGQGPQLKLRTFAEDTLSGPELQVSSAEVEALVRPAMAPLNDGGFVVVWADKRADERIRAQRFGLDGEKVGSELRANTLAGLHQNPMVACLTNGNIVFGWRARLPGPLLVHLQVLDANGAVGGEQTTALDITQAAMAPLDSGRFVITDVRNAGDGETGFETTVPAASLFEASGASAGIRFKATAGRVLSSWPAIVPLSGGRFVLAWTELNVDAPAAGTNVMARLFSAQGAIGKAVRVNTSTGNERFSLSIAATSAPDGETLFAVWNDDNPGGGDTSGRAVRGRPLPIPAGGF